MPASYWSHPMMGLDGRVLTINNVNNHNKWGKNYPSPLYGIEQEMVAQTSCDSIALIGASASLWRYFSEG
jgi:hypothetical protein